LWQAYIDAVKYFHMDGWFTYGEIAASTRGVSTTQSWVLDTDEKKVLEITYHTPRGALTEQILYSHDKPPMRIKKLIADIDLEWPRFRYLLGPIEAVDLTLIEQQKREWGELGVYGIGVYTPGFHYWHEFLRAVCRPSVISR